MPENDTRPQPREYAAMSYDERERRLIVFGGWNNGWLNDLYTLDVSKIVGPSYAITSIDPPLGQISGGVEIKIKGVGFGANNIQVYFTPGNQPTMYVSKQALTTVGNWVSETELTAVTPDFSVFGEKREAVVQLTISGGDLTTTYVNYSFFLDTQPDKTLCYGPGIMQDCSTHDDVKFIIQARNENEENRTSGRDHFQVTITTKDDPPREVPCEIEDTDDGKYYVKYRIEHECEVDIRVQYQDGKGKWNDIRGSPYTASFTPEADAKVNSLTGPTMVKYIQEQIAKVKQNFEETTEGAKLADKDLSEVKTLIGVKDCVEHVQNETKTITLGLDQLHESLQYLSQNGVSKDKEAKQVRKLFEEWTQLKKIARETSKEIQPLVENESKKNMTTITKFEESLKTYISDLKKRDFYKYDTGKAQASETLVAVQSEIDGFKKSLSDLEFTAGKFEHPDAITNSKQQIEVIEVELEAMNSLWGHIGTCQDIFDENLTTTWLQTNSDDMEEVVKKLQKQLKEMKVDKRCNTYTGILEEIKRWIVFLPLVGQLRDQSMRDRHWDAIRDKVKTDFQINDQLLLKNIWDLQLTKIAEDVEEITDQAVQEARMEKQLKAIAEFWKDIKFDFSRYKNTDVQMLRLSEENFEALEENQTVVTAMFSSRYLATFEDTVNMWNKNLAGIAEVVLLCGEVQRTWSFLENLFIHSEEVKKELPKQSEAFIQIDLDVKRILADGYAKQIALDFCT